MAKMDEDKLLSHLQVQEQDASAYAWGQLASDRRKGMREYFRMPYGDEQEGLSQIVTSEVQDSIEWILPDLLDIFVSTDKAVVFDPCSEEDVKGAEQATDAVNYIFYKQNNGFLVLYNAFKDALMVKNCAIHWRKEEKRTKTIVPVTGATAEMLTMILQESGKGAEIESSTPLPPQPMMMPPQMGPQGPMPPQPMIDPATGQPVMGPQLFNARISKIEKKKSICVETFPPESLLIKRDWTSPILADCPYVCRPMQVTLSELWEMGYTDITAEDLRSSDDASFSADRTFRLSRQGGADSQFQGETIGADDADDSLVTGTLYIEYVLVDFDGDGISERRCIYRLKDKILKNEEGQNVPIATASPILVPHRWDGMSLAEIASDLQLAGTEITRQMIDSGRLAMNPRTNVLTDADWSPLANIDDMLDSRPGGIRRQRDPNAIQEVNTPWVGAQMFPMLEYIDSRMAKRTGVSNQSQGLDANALNRGGMYEAKVMTAGQKRIKLMARVFGEVLIKPMFLGILKELTDGEMEPLAFKLRNEFVKFDPSEWRDQYEMTVNVGTGTGDREFQSMVLEKLATRQAGLAMSPFGKLLIKPKNIYNTESRLIEAAGFKNVGDFFLDPGDQVPQPPPPPVDPQVQITQMKLAAEAHKFQAESQQIKEIEMLKHQAKIQEAQAELELQAQNDRRDGEREMLKAQHDAQIEDLRSKLERYKVDADNQTKIIVAQISHPPMPESDAGDASKANEKQDDASLASAKKVHDVVRGPDGKIAQIVSSTVQ